MHICDGSDLRLHTVNRGGEPHHEVICTIPEGERYWKKLHKTRAHALSTAALTSGMTPVTPSSTTLSPPERCRGPSNTEGEPNLVLGRLLHLQES